MKKIICTMVVICAVVFGVCGGYAAGEFETWYVGAWSGLNCRTEPTTESEILTIYPRGAELQIIGVDDSGKWWETWDGTLQGWCCSTYLVNSINDSESVYSGAIGECLGIMRITGYTSNPAENGGSSVNCFDEPLEPLVNKIVAVDPSVIPLKRIVYIEGIGYRETRDTGVCGRVIDVLTSSDGESNAITGDYKVYLVN